MSLNPLELTGRAETHLVALPEHPYRDGKGLPFRVHAAVKAPFLAMCEAAAQDGIAIRLVSAFRDFEHQASIWRAKASGQRPLYTLDGGVLDFATLSEEELVHAILRWSALPGTSRHHWGSDVDIIDANGLADGYKLKLVPEEFVADGPFARLKPWLDEHLPRFGFFHPYAEFNGGVAAEPWHISFAPVSMPALEQLSPALIGSVVLENELPLRDVVLRNLPQLEQTYIRNIRLPGFTVTPLDSTSIRE